MGAVQTAMAVSTTSRSANESLWNRALRFVRSLLVGGAATIVDFAVLIMCARALGLDPTLAKMLAFLAGAWVQFVGNKHFTFKARGGDTRRQAVLFALAETITFGLHAVCFTLLVKGLSVPLELANAIVGFCVYAGFSYPMWKWVFRTERTDPSSERSSIRVA
jgi:putative flippase GtrA